MASHVAHRRRALQQIAAKLAFDKPVLASKPSALQARKTLSPKCLCRHASSAPAINAKHKQWSEQLRRTTDKDRKMIFGPRRIYDAALKTDKVLSITYEEILELTNCTDRFDDISKRVSAKDLLIVSKIMRRAPPIAPSDEGLRVHRLALARLLLTCASDLGYPEAQMFWAEETLSNSQYPKEEADKALRLLTDLGGQAVQPSTERRQASPDAPPPIAARANFLLGQYLWAAGEMVESTQQRKNLRDRALAHFERAGEQGHGQAYFVLGQKYRAQGQAAKAQAAYEKAHAAGNAEATFMLAQSTKDESKRKTLLATAAGGGSLSAAHNLGEVYRQSGQDALAIEYYTLAARAGVFISQSNLAELYLKRGDFDKAEHWFMAVSKAPEGNVKKGTRSKDDVASFAKTRLEQMQQSQAYIDHQNAKTKGGGSCIVM